MRSAVPGWRSALVCATALASFASAAANAGPGCNCDQPPSRGYGQPYAPPQLEYQPAPVARYGAPSAVGAAPRRRQAYDDQGYNKPAWVPPAIWTGMYAGVHGGYNWSSMQAGAPVGASIDASGCLFGLHLGHNWQSGSIVAGLELDMSGHAVHGQSALAGATLSASNNWAGSARLRAGYAWQNWLFYGSIGLAAGQFDLTYANSAGSSQSRDVLYGLVYGAGAEIKIAPNVSARLEALRYDYKETNLSLAPGSTPFNPDHTTVRAGVTFHLN